MKKYVFCILICVTSLFCLTGIKGETLPFSRGEKMAMVQNANYVDRGDLITSGVGQGDLAAGDRFLLDDFHARICDAPVGVSLAPRGISSSKHLKFISTIKVLSSQDSPLFTRSTKNVYLHYCFVKSSCRYFVYTLERLLN